MTTTDTTPGIPAAHRSVLKGVIGNALAEHAGAVDTPTQITATVAGALAELGYGALLEELDRTRAERDAAEAKLDALAQVRVWRDGDGHGFLDADDVAAAIGIEQVGISEAAHRARVLRETADRADAMGYLWGPHLRQWADEAEAEPCTCEPDGPHHAAHCPAADTRQPAEAADELGRMATRGGAPRG